MAQDAPSRLAAVTSGADGVLRPRMRLQLLLSPWASEKETSASRPGTASMVENGTP